MAFVRLSRLEAAALVVASVLAAGHARGQTTCVPGQQVACACPDGSNAVQVCADDGQQFLPCACKAAPQLNGCTKDSDCHGDRICEAGACTERAATPAPAPTAAPQPAPAPAPTAAPVLAAAPAARLGKLHVSSLVPARVLIDGEVKGRTPLNLDDLESGSYTVRVEFDAPVNGHRQEVVFVQAGTAARVHAEPSRARLVAAHRAGFTVGASLGGGFFPILDEAPGGGGWAALVMNVGILPAVDFRTGVEAGGGVWSESVGQYVQQVRSSPWFMVAVPAKFCFNLGSVYTMMVGARVGVSSYERSERACNPSYEDDCIEESLRNYGFLVEPTLSVLSFRFGERRQFELTLQQSAHIVFGGQEIEPTGAFEPELQVVDEDPVLKALRADLFFTWMFLPDALPGISP